jgi:hypothetical protein
MPQNRPPSSLQIACLWMLVDLLLHRSRRRRSAGMLACCTADFQSAGAAAEIALELESNRPKTIQPGRAETCDTAGKNACATSPGRRATRLFANHLHQTRLRRLICWTRTGTGGTRGACQRVPIGTTRPRRRPRRAVRSLQAGGACFRGWPCCGGIGADGFRAISWPG